MKSLISGIKDPAEKQRAIRDLEFLLLTPAEQAKLREERTNRRMPGGGPRFNNRRQLQFPFHPPVRSVHRGILLSGAAHHRDGGSSCFPGWNHVLRRR